MKRILFLSFLLLASCLLWAQDKKPRRQHMDWFESVKSPEISADGDVTFRIFAPQAKTVILSSQFCPDMPMKWDDDEQLWKVTVHPAIADIYPYNFIVDGVPVSDPNNKEIFPNELFKASLLEMPASEMLYTKRNIRHGAVHYCDYYSTVLDEPRRMLVYTPADYGDDLNRQYPVLYLVSGTTDTEETWYKVGRANFIMDNLIEEGKANKMIVVMPYGNMNTGNPRPSSDAAAECYEIFSQEMERCILPFVEKNFRTRPGRENRAIAGFSRGGGEALYTAFRLKDKFSSVCAYSAYLTDEVYERKFADLVGDAAAMNQLYSLIWFGIGDKDFLLEGVRQNQDYFRRKGITFEQFDTSGGHTWMNARLFLGLTAPKLFKVHDKVVEDGGSGPWKSCAVSEESLPGFTIYRPQDMSVAVESEGRLPVLLFANGACMDSNTGYEKMLGELASYGYFVVAVGEIQRYQFDRAEHSTSSRMLADALDWVLRQAKDKGEKYHGFIDAGRIAAAGHSCGGAQVLANCRDKHIKTCLILNAGMGSMSMAGASAESLRDLHGPVIYLTGGPGDIAYRNAQEDYDAIDHVPVVLADNESSGHGGTYGHPGGGSYARLVREWLDWQLKGRKSNAGIFLSSAFEQFPDWTFKNKGF